MMLFNKLLILCVKCKLLGSKPLNMGTRSSARSPSPLKRPGVLPLPSGIVGHPLPQHYSGFPQWSASIRLTPHSDLNKFGTPELRLSGLQNRRKFFGLFQASKGNCSSSAKRCHAQGKECQNFFSLRARSFSRM